MRSVVWTWMLVLALVACSDDAEPVEDGGVDGEVTDLALDVGLDLSPDGGAPACDPATLGSPCTQGGNECGSVNTCLVTSGQSGFCSCGCVPDLPGTEVMDEDSCPGKDFACGLDAAGESRCFRVVANTPQHPNCSDDAAIMADPADPPFMVVARLTPPAPFTLTGIRYLLYAPFGSASECDNGLAHRAEVHVNDQGTPSETPAPVGSFSLPAAAATQEPRWVVRALDPPVALKAGEAIYVTVEVVRDGAKSICVQACADDAATGAQSFIDVDSNQPPYVWESFEDKSWPGELTFAALGF